MLGHLMALGVEMLPRHSLEMFLLTNMSQCKKGKGPTKDRDEKTNCRRGAWFICGLKLRVT